MGMALRARTSADWNLLAEKRLNHYLRKTATFPGLRKLGSRARWQVTLKLLGSPAMARMNRDYRGKEYATDVLSFPAPAVFRAQGLLGDLVICLPVLKRQAKELGHSAEFELDVLLVHGLLHLLGLDHEVGEAEARKMARWEDRILGRASGPRKGLVSRNSA